MKRIGLKFLFWLNAFILTFVVATLACFVWFVKFESGLIFMSSQATFLAKKLLGQDLSFEDPTGNLWDGFGVKGVGWSNARVDLQINDLRLKFSWLDLMDDKITIDYLVASKMSIRVEENLAESTNALEMPESIVLPLAVEFKKFELEKLVLNQKEFDSIKGVLGSDRQVVEISQFQLSHLGTYLKGQLKSGLTQPFPLDLQVQVQSSLDKDLNLTATAYATGDLNELELHVSASGQSVNRPKVSQQLEASLVLAPLSSGVVKAIDARAKGFDPSKWFEGAPKADLVFEAKLTPNQDFTRSSGRLLLTNLRPLAIDEGGIPLEKLNSRYSMELVDNQPDNLLVQIVGLTLRTSANSAGFVNGEVQWFVPKGVQSSWSRWGDWRFDLKGQQVHLRAFVPEHKGAIIDFGLKGSKSSGILIVDDLLVGDRGAQLTGQGRVALLDDIESQIRLDVRALNPAIYLDHTELKGEINAEVFWVGDLGLSGAIRSIDPQGRLKIGVNRSRLLGAPLTLNADLQGSLRRAEKFDLQLDMLGNSLSANGAYGAPGDSLSLKVLGRELGALGKALNRDVKGELTAQGQLTGFGKDTLASLNIQVNQLLLGEVLGIEKMNGQLNFGLEPDSPWNGNLVLKGLSRAGVSAPLIQDLDLVVSGTTAAHRVELSFASGQSPFSRRRSLGGHLNFSGGVNHLFSSTEAVTWDGSIDDFQLMGIWRPVRSLTLQQPVALKVSRQQIEVQAFSLQGEDNTRLLSEHLMWSDGLIHLEGQAPWLALPRLGSVLKQQVTLETNNLVTRLNWKVKATRNQFDGHLDARYVSGGFSILEDAEIEVPVKELALAVDFSRERIALGLSLDAAQIGVVLADLTVPVKKDLSSGRWGLAKESPISGSLAAGLTDLSWLGPLMSPAVRTQGDGQVSLAIAGTIDRPELQGRMFARQLSVTELDQGIRLEEGNVVVDFNNDRAKIENFDFTVYHRQAPSRRIEELGPLIQGVGKVTVSGQWNLSGLGGGLELSMDRVGLIQHPDRWLMISAGVSIKQPLEQDKPILVRGDVQAHGAYIELPESQPQTLGSDVVIRGTTQAKGDSLPFDVLINAKLGDLFFLNAEGLRARLAGGMRLLVQDGVRTVDGRLGRRLEASGTIQTAEGTYRAYGQDLTIERGVVNFQGPLNNPGLNVRAVRKGVAVEAGVEITGSANRPKVTLVSDPPVPDAEKLSWMIIGRGSNSSDRDTTLLLTAAAAIFGDTEDSATNKLAKSLGIDDFALSSGSLTAADSRAVGSRVSISPGADASASVVGDEDPLLTQRLITLGKRLSQNLYLNFEQSVTTSANVVKLTYQYSRRLSFIARGGADNAVDALYQFSFD